MNTLFTIFSPLLLLQWATVTSLPFESRLEYNPLIVGGQEATAGEFPWQCSLKQEFILGTYLHICGAVIYKENILLTAAHCVETQLPSLLRVVCGEHDFRYTEGPEQIRNIQAIAVHPLRNVETKENDLAYLTLDAPLEFSPAVQPLKIARNVEAIAKGGKCVNTGWGNTRGDGSLWSSSILLKVYLDLVPFENCQQRYKELIQIEHSMICAGHVEPEDAEEQRGPCNGDSGGPLVCPDADGNFQLVGVVSFGTKPCALVEYPGVFANVMTMEPWLQQSLGHRNEYKIKNE